MVTHDDYNAAGQVLTATVGYGSWQAQATTYGYSPAVSDTAIVACSRRARHASPDHLVQQARSLGFDVTRQPASPAA